MSAVADAPKVVFFMTEHLITDTARIRQGGMWGALGKNDCLKCSMREPYFVGGFCCTLTITYDIIHFLVNILLESI